jgi:hypothetical protein
MPSVDVCEAAKLSELYENSTFRVSSHRHSRFKENIGSGLALRFQIRVFVAPSVLAANVSDVVRREQNDNCLPLFKCSVQYLAYIREPLPVRAIAWFHSMGLRLERVGR